MKFHREFPNCTKYTGTEAIVSSLVAALRAQVQSYALPYGRINFGLVPDFPSVPNAGISSLPCKDLRRTS